MNSRQSNRRSHLDLPTTHQETTNDDSRVVRHPLPKPVLTTTGRTVASDIKPQTTGNTTQHHATTDAGNPAITQAHTPIAYTQTTRRLQRPLGLNLRARVTPPHE
jgi:hypothetical protein